MKKTIAIALLSLAFAAPDRAAAQPRFGPPGPDWGPGPIGRFPNLAGTWFMNGDPNLRTEIIQTRPDGRALFVNENGDEAWGTIQGDGVWIPGWTDGRRRGLSGRLRGDRIVWPDGSYWSRQPEYDYRPRYRDDYNWRR